MLVDLSSLEPLLGIEAWFNDKRPRALILRPLGFLVLEEPSIRSCNAMLYALTKANIDTLHAIQNLTHVIGKSSYAGLKDADGITTQFIAARQWGQYAYSRAGFRSYTLACTNTRGCIKIGDVKFNHFSITLALLDGEAETRTTSIAPNYYGFQRFGTRRPNTHYTGLSLARGDLGRYFAELIYTKYPRETSRRGDYERLALKLLRATRSTIRALKHLPPKVLELHVNALQSYLFNRILSRLVTEYSTRVCTTYPRIPVPGCGLSKYLDALDEDVKRVYREVMGTEGVEESYFCTLRRYGIHASSYMRESCIEPAMHFSLRLKVEEYEDVEIAIHVFSLKRGEYATTFLANMYRLFEPEPYFLAGQFGQNPL